MSRLSLCWTLHTHPDARARFLSLYTPNLKNKLAKTRPYATHELSPHIHTPVLNTHTARLPAAIAALGRTLANLGPDPSLRLTDHLPQPPPRPLPSQAEGGRSVVPLPCHQSASTARGHHGYNPQTFVPCASRKPRSLPVVCRVRLFVPLRHINSFKLSAHPKQTARYLQPLSSLPDLCPIPTLTRQVLD